MVKRKITEKQILKLKAKMKTLRKELKGMGPVMRGSIVHIGTRDKQYYFSLNKDKKTKIIYLGKNRVDRARRFSKNYKKLLDIIEEMTIINMELIKNDVKI